MVGGLMPRVSNEVSVRSRRLLDAHFAEWQQLRGVPRPPRGWVREIREALGMSAAALAARMGTTAGAVTRLGQAAAVEQTMSLEDQATGQAEEMEDQLTQQLLDRGELWSGGPHD